MQLNFRHINLAGAILALLALQETVTESDDPNVNERFSGICWNWQIEYDGNAGMEMYDLVVWLSPGWEHFSGNTTYPVEEPVGGPRPFDRWAPGQLELRRSLIAYLLEELNKLEENGEYFFDEDE